MRSGANEKKPDPETTMANAQMLPLTQCSCTSVLSDQKMILAVYVRRRGLLFVNCVGGSHLSARLHRSFIQQLARYMQWQSFIRRSRLQPTRMCFFSSFPRFHLSHLSSPRRGVRNRFRADPSAWPPAGDRGTVPAATAIARIARRGMHQSVAAPQYRPVRVHCAVVVTRRRQRRRRQSHFEGEDTFRRRLASSWGQPSCQM